MIEILKIAALILTALCMGLTLAHALEYPGKMRLTRQSYLTVQTIYYPGFTYAGAAEPAAILVLAILALLTPARTQSFWLIVISCVAAALTHFLYWFLTAPVNKLWMKDEKLAGSEKAFFGTDSQTADISGGWPSGWIDARTRWEHSHMLRAATATIAFVILVLAVVI